MTDNTYSLASQNRVLDPMRVLESLTPGGSEFVGDPQRCADVIRYHREMQHRVIRDFSKRARTAEAELAEARSLLETIANSTEHADAAQKWELEKAELLGVLRQVARYLPDNPARKVMALIAKYEAPKDRNPAMAKFGHKSIAKYEAK